jgi:hypothetical protein
VVRGQQLKGLLQVLALPDFERVGAIQTYCGYPEIRAFAELLIDCEGPSALGGAGRDAVGLKRRD